MFRIHEHQIAHFERKLRASFERRMTAWLCEAYPDSFAGATEDEVAGWVSAAVDKATMHGFVTEGDVAALMLLFLVIGVDADETTPWAREVLADRRLQPEGKVKELVTRARERGVPGIDAVVLEDAREEEA